MPVIISDIEENKEVAGNRTTSFKNKNANDLAKKIDFAINNYKQIKINTELAKKAVDKEYDWNNIVNQTIGLYKQPFKSVYKPRLAK